MVREKSRKENTPGVVENFHLVLEFLVDGGQTNVFASFKKSEGHKVYKINFFHWSSENLCSIVGPEFAQWNLQHEIA